ncbi:Type 1 glutamine amidotransferase-like domain-containing protein [Caballeronia sp. LZ065]|uniref:Type 1 glutamine amidotransferase-like domain-containing protein n=1 Tax=Caballeronia sp. LZ065 TaxID=3038571 RepID=UPI0038575A86
MSQDAIFVGGGHLRSALAVWREWGLDVALEDAWNDGVLLAGMSAGAMCRCEAALGGPIEQGNHRIQRGLGLIPRACAAHCSKLNISWRRANLLSEVHRGLIPPTLAIDAYAAVLFKDHTLARTVSRTNMSTAHRVERRNGRVEETPRVAVVE